MHCKKCKSRDVAEDPIGGMWCQSCGYAWHPSLATPNAEQRLVMDKIEEAAEAGLSYHHDGGEEHYHDKNGNRVEMEEGKRRIKFERERLKSISFSNHYGTKAPLGD